MLRLKLFKEESGIEEFVAEKVKQVFVKIQNKEALNELDYSIIQIYYIARVKEAVESLEL
jgi:hypothetical protein